MAVMAVLALSPKKNTGISINILNLRYSIQYHGCEVSL